MNSELIRYADRLRAENIALRAEIAQTRLDLKNHIALSERRFQELYGYLTHARSGSSAPEEPTPLMPNASLPAPSLAAPLFTL